MMQPVGGRKRFSGQLLGANDREITLDVDGGRVQLPIADIHKARLAPRM
jgi:ribosome maturation factor RimP